MRFFIVFLRFLLNFRGLRTSIIVLPCTREHDPREIAVFVFGPPCRWILAHFHLIFDPKTLQNGLRDPLEKKVDFWYLFCRFFGRFLGPFGPLGEAIFAKKACHTLGERTFWPSGTPRGRFFGFSSFFLPIWGSILEPPGVIWDRFWRLRGRFVADSSGRFFAESSNLRIIDSSHHSARRNARSD